MSTEIVLFLLRWAVITDLALLGIALFWAIGVLARIAGRLDGEYAHLRGKAKRQALDDTQEEAKG